MNSLVVLRNAVVLADRYPVLAGLNLDVAEGECLALTGPNGAGKTSVLRLLAGFSRLHSGEGRVCGFDLDSQRRSVRSSAGYVAHQPFAYEDLTVLENLKFHCRNSGSAPQTILETVGLGERRNVPAAMLSAGQRRRLGIATLFARDPQLWLLDEPYSGLDSKGRELLDGLVASARSAGKTIIFSSHDTTAVKTISTRTVCVRGGVVEQVVDVGAVRSESGTDVS